MTDLVTQAMEFAIAAHGEQTRKFTGELYVVHPAEVADMVAAVGAPPEAIAAAWLHDVVEDTAITQLDIDREFPTLTAQLVAALTEQPARPGGPNRAARKRAIRTRFLMMQDTRAIWAHTIKAADCLSNAVSIKQHDAKFWPVFREEVTLLANVLTLAETGLLDQLADVLEVSRRDHSRQLVWPV
jgi:(p)ppGpp synthase/HD superfamily hydrolase